MFKKYRTRSKPPKNGKYPVPGNPETLGKDQAKGHPEDCDCEWMLIAEDAERKNGKIVADKSEAYWMVTIGESCMESSTKKVKEAMNRGKEKFNQITEDAQNEEEDN